VQAVRSDNKPGFFSHATAVSGPAADASNTPILEQNLLRRKFLPQLCARFHCRIDEDLVEHANLAQGISVAFRDAEGLANAIDNGFSGRQALEDALADYERQRNESAMPGFELNFQFATLQPPPPEMQALFGTLRGNQTEINRFVGALVGTIPIPEFFAPANIQRILTEAPWRLTVALEPSKARRAFGCHAYIEEAEEDPGNKERRHRARQKPIRGNQFRRFQVNASTCEPHKKTSYGEIGSETCSEEK
jgi:hypothetical protein